MNIKQIISLFLGLLTTGCASKTEHMSFITRIHYPAVVSGSTQFIESLKGMQFKEGQPPPARIFITELNEAPYVFSVSIPNNFLVESYQGVHSDPVNGKTPEGLTMTFNAETEENYGSLSETITYIQLVNCPLDMSPDPENFTQLRSKNNVKYTYSQEQTRGQTVKILSAAFPSIRTRSANQHLFTEKTETSREIRSVEFKDGIVAVCYDLSYPITATPEEKTQIMAKMTSFFEVSKVLSWEESLIDDIALEFFPKNTSAI